MQIKNCPRIEELIRRLSLASALAPALGLALGLALAATATASASALALASYLSLALAAYLSLALASAPALSQLHLLLLILCTDLWRVIIYDQLLALIHTTELLGFPRLIFPCPLYLLQMSMVKLRIPFQGETFRCHWKTDDFCDNDADDSSSYPAPPKPWLKSENIGRNDLTFVAEQVSCSPSSLCRHYYFHITIS